MLKIVDENKRGIFHKRRKWLLASSVLAIFIGVAVLISFKGVFASTQKAWDFSSSSNYTYDNTKIEFSSGEAKLKELSSPGWADTDWQYRKKITIDHTKTSGSLTDYPLFVDLASDADISSKSLSNGNDIFFTDSTGVTRLYSDLLNGSSDWSIASSDGAWCWFQDPRAVYYNGITYIGTVTTKGDIKVSAYNNASNEVTNYILHPSLQPDDHAVPSILLLPDKRLMVFYSAHNGSNMYYRTSTNPGDISAWSAESTVGTNTAGTKGYSYPNPVQLSSESNKIYLFWRGADWEPTFSSSSDGGSSWSTAQDLIYVAGERPYVKYASNNEDKIAFTFGDGHPDSVATDSVYFAYYKNGNFYKADGTLIGDMASLPITPGEADKVYDSVATGVKAWVWDIALDSSDNPVIVYATFPSTSNHVYRYAKWNGTSWEDHEITAAGGYIDGAEEPYYSGGLALDHEDPSVVYLSREISGQYEIEKWTTSDNGGTWSSDTITSSSTLLNARPVSPRNHTATSPNVLWMYGSYKSYTDYSLSIITNRSTSANFGNAEAHVKIPSLSSISDTDLYVYYNNPDASSQQSEPSSVWDTNYKTVYHLNSSLGRYLYDSTINDILGYKDIAGNPTEAVGKVGKAQDYDGSSGGYIVGFLDMAAWDQLTAEMWVKYEKSVSSHKYTIFSNWNASPTKAALLARIDPATNALQSYVITQGDTSVGGTFTDLTLDSNWHHITITYDTTNGLRAYKDNTLSSTSFAAHGNLDSDSSTDFEIGYTDHSTEQFEGIIDEVRISNTVRSSDLIATEINNQNSPSTFYTLSLIQICMYIIIIRMHQASNPSHHLYGILIIKPFIISTAV